MQKKNAAKSTATPSKPVNTEPASKLDNTRSADDPSKIALQSKDIQKL